MHYKTKKNMKALTLSKKEGAKSESHSLNETDPDPVSLCKANITWELERHLCLEEKPRHSLACMVRPASGLVSEKPRQNLAYTVRLARP